MTRREQHPEYTRVRGQDLTFWWLDSPMQRTTMAMLMVLDRAPEPERLRVAFERAVADVPRLAQRVADAPLDITLPRWEVDPTFNLDYHVRRHALSGAADLNELFREIGPTYETPFDRSRPLWEARIYDGVGPDNQSAMFFKLHHCVADGVGGNAIFAAMTDWERDPSPLPVARPRHPAREPWPAEQSFRDRLVAAVRDRVELDLGRATAVANEVWDAIKHPEKFQRALQIVRSIAQSSQFDSHSPLKKRAGRTRRLTGMSLPFDEVRALKRTLGGSMIDVILTVMVRAIGKWHAKHGVTGVDELMTLVPVNLRKPEEWTDNVNTGNVATGILVPLPIRMRDPLALYREVHRRMEEKKADPASGASPIVAELFTVLPRPLLSWMSEATFGNIDFIVTNVPGILIPRYLAGAEIVAAYPFAPVARTSPATVALYGYRDRLFIGLDSDDALMPDVERFQDLIREAFAEFQARVAARGARRPASKTRTTTPRSDRA